MRRLFVFPSLTYIAVNIFVGSLVGSSITLLAEVNDCNWNGWECKWPAIVVLFAVIFYLLLCLSILMHFHRKHRPVMWQPSKSPTDPGDVEDPLYRQVSKLRVQHCSKRRRFAIIDRARGEFKRSDNDIAEPTRTERLLSHPFSLYRSRGSDALDALKLLWLNRSGGTSLVGLSYDYLSFMVTVMIAGVLGFGPALEKGSAAATAQIAVVATLQFGFAAHVFLNGPGNDRIENVLHGTQFCVEGIMTALVMRGQYAADDGERAGLLTLAFGAGLIAMFLPFVEKGYDLFIALPSAWCRRHRGEQVSCRSVCFALMAFLFTIPGLIASLLGIRLDTAADLTTTFADEAAGAVEMGMDDVVAGSNALADVFSDMYWSQYQMPQYHQAAMTLQKVHRGKLARRQLHTTTEQQRALAVREAAQIVQAAFRAKRAAQRRARAREMLKSRGVNPRGQYASRVERPQLQWLLQRERAVMQHEAADEPPEIVIDGAAVSGSEASPPPSPSRRSVRRSKATDGRNRLRV